MGSETAPLTDDERRAVTLQIRDDILGYGPVQMYLDDPTVTEIMVNAETNIYVERDGRLIETDTRFMSRPHLRRVIDRIVTQVGRRIDESSPMVDARLPDGSRVNAVIPPLAVDGPALTIRKFAADPLQVDDLIAMGTMTPLVAQLTEAAVRGKLNILVSGGTGTGKTTLLNVLSGFIPESERIVTIEDAVELQLHQKHVIRLESRPPNVEGRGEIAIRDLVRNALRMRPDRIVVGEARGGEALDMLQAMNTGHEGSLSTVHSNTPRDTLSRLETMVLMAGVDLPSRAIREQIASAIDVIVHLSRMRDGSRRITHITEVVPHGGRPDRAAGHLRLRLRRRHRRRRPVPRHHPADRSPPPVRRSAQGPGDRSARRRLRYARLRAGGPGEDALMRRLLIAGLLAAALAPTAAWAQADPDEALVIEDIDTSRHPEVSMVVAMPGSLSGDALAPDAFTVTENGTPLSGHGDPAGWRRPQRRPRPRRIRQHGR